MIKISVIIPTYNRELTVKRCIQSVMNQTEKPYEIIVVDDGSSDDTVRIVKGFEKSTIIRMIKQEHYGAQVARNRGIIEAKGDYVTFLDSDDEFMPDMIKKQKIELEKKPESILYFDCFVDDESLKKRYVWHTYGGSGYIHDELLKAGGPIFGGLICKKELFLKIGYLDERVSAYQEWDTVIRLSKYAEMVHIREPLYVWYRYNGGSISNSSVRSIDGMNYIIEKYRDEISDTWGNKVLEQRYEYLLGESIKHGGYLFDDLLDKLLEIKQASNSHLGINQCVVEWGKETYIKYDKVNKEKELLKKWISIKDIKKSLIRYFNEISCTKIAIYGMGYWGQLLVKEFKTSDVEVQYGIDINANEIKSNIKIIHPEDKWDDVDMVVVTAISYYKEINDQYQNKYSMPIVSLESILNLLLIEQSPIDR